jgi:saccharopine dehydrogenase-like NADP-dependent oxidoreductase
LKKQNLLIIGAGGVAKVAAFEINRYANEFNKIYLASRNLQKCQLILEEITQEQKATQIIPLTLDASNSQNVVDLIQKNSINIVLNLGPSFINMTVMQACLKAGSAYIDTAIHEEQDKICETPPWYANYEWTLKEKFANQGLTAILGAGFDPGVVNSYAKLTTEIFDSIDSIDILDVNDGNHGQYFATNFDPEVNFREFTGVVYSWQNNQWQTNQMFEIKRQDDLPEVGLQTLYMSGHDEIHSLHQNLQVPNIRFWMSFSDHYINVFTVLKNVGLLSEQPVTTAEGIEVVPLKVVKAVLPDPASLAPNYSGKTCIGNLTKGIINGQEKELFIYNILDHQTAYALTKSQGISFTAGTPAIAAARLLNNGTWQANKMVNIEELEAQPFLQMLDAMQLTTRIKMGDIDLPWQEFLQLLAKK